jgi:GTPase SAR1 family protein
MNQQQLLQIIEQAARDQAISLNLSRKGLTVLPPEIGQLTSLAILNLDGNELTALPAEIGKLTNLVYLYLNYNRLPALTPEIGQLSYLRLLDLRCNELITLPLEISQLTNLVEIDLYKNPLTSLPPEIVSQGTRAILAYLRGQLKAATRQWVSKMLLVGQGGVGKTCLLRALRGEPFASQETTHGILIRSLALPHPTQADATMQLMAWDFGGQEIYHATHQFFLTNRSLFLLVWNARHGYEQGRLYQWLDTIHALAPDSPVLLVATWIDERSADLPLADLCRKYPQIVGHYAVSNKTGQGIDDLRQAIAAAAAALPLMGEKWPTTWLNAANALRASPEKYVTPAKLRTILATHGVRGQDASILAQWLHELGDILYFRDNEELSDLVILKPQWVTEYISKVLESQEVQDGNGIFTRQHMEALWPDLDPAMREHFLCLMERFDLSYRTLENREISLVVERLPLDPPDYTPLWDTPRSTGEYGEIAMRFQLSTVPSGIPT